MSSLAHLNSEIEKILREAGSFSGPVAVEIPEQKLASLIEHTLLKPTAVSSEITQLCQEARTHGFATVCVNSAFVPLAAQELRGSGVSVAAVVGFPLGAMHTRAKAAEARVAMESGAQELDMVIALGALQEQNYTYVIQDIQAVVEAAAGAPVKVILETSVLSTEQKVAGCLLSKLAGAQYVKTSTGFGSGFTQKGATAEDVRLMRVAVGPELGVKASGGIRTREDALKMVLAGANRLGTSSGVAIISSRSESA